MLFSPPRCPLCNAEVDARDLRRLFPRDRWDPLGAHWGIHCPSCRAALRVRLWWPYLLTLVLGVLAVSGAIRAAGRLSILPMRQQVQVALVIAFGLWTLIVYRWLALLAQ